ncbi:neutral zinc metallopeptidase [Blastococcus sp. BMG 814]|uniref:Neutral zinc metallopeptidase n=1 Tax=Blastococcus carthaginiensis TaxID=3050034 RepID=A0ABT9ICD7_9ACTN|nr:neutral zinc metallopeptidase [Blastococcus carthaginiensis]MDP5183233.1 neutral zinc metallopeptidase [Blastococcus carthaginiensis]
MRQLLHRVAPVVVAALVLTGCAAGTVRGQATPPDDGPTDVTAGEFPVTGAGDEPIDQFARNALADLDAFWAQAYPEYFGEEYTPLAGGYFSVDSEALDESAYPGTGIGCEGSYTAPEDVAGNAFYDPTCDVIAYDRALLQELSDDYGRFLVPVVMAHEFGHAMQGRFGFAESGRSIQDETQADCLAGAWTRWVADGRAAHLSLREPELDDVVRGFLLLRDDVGSDPDDVEAHGSYFDRVSAFYDGFERGLGTCRDAFGADRLFTAAAFTPTDLDQGNADFADIVDWVGATLPVFWGEVFPAAFGGEFEEPEIAGFVGSAPGCDGLDGRDLGYCADDRTVYIDETDLAVPAYDEIGDFALATAMALPYALAVRDQAGLTVDDGEATRSAVCLTGWYQAQWYNAEFSDVVGAEISPGDLDEAVQFLLRYGVEDEVFPGTDASGFELVGAFRNGFLDGGAACGIGV